MKKNVLLASNLVFMGLCAYLLISAYSTQPEQKEEKVEHIMNNNSKSVVYSLTLPEQMNFAGENVPLEDPEIRERLDRELLVNNYWQSNALLMIKRAHKYFPIIEPILKKNGVPDDFKYLALAESGFMQVVSPAGATGFWQIMEATGKEYGLEINSNIDERYHIEKATEVASQLFFEFEKTFWKLDTFCCCL